MRKFNRHMRSLGHDKSNGIGELAIGVRMRPLLKLTFNQIVGKPSVTMNYGTRRNNI